MSESQFRILKTEERIIQEHKLKNLHKNPFEEARDFTPSMEDARFRQGLNPIEVWYTEKSKLEIIDNGSSSSPTSSYLDWLEIMR